MLDWKKKLLIVAFLLISSIAIASGFIVNSFKFGGAPAPSDTTPINHMAYSNGVWVLIVDIDKQ